MRNSGKEIETLIMAFLLLALLPLDLYADNIIKAASNVEAVDAGEDANITVNVTDLKDYAINHAQVTFSVVSGGGFVKPEPVFTNLAGITRTVFTTGNTPGMNILKIEADTTDPVFISIKGMDSPPLDFSVNIDQEIFYPETSGRITVFVNNTKNRPCSNVPVIINSTKLMVLEQSSGKTDAGGKFCTGVKAGKNTGTVKLEVSAGTLSSQIKEISIIPSPITSFQTTAESYDIFTKSSTTLKVKVEDIRKNPAANIKVSFSVTEGAARFEPAEAVTAADGICFVKLRSGDAEGTIVAGVKLINEERAKDLEPALLTINVTSLILPPAKLELKANHSFVTAGDEVTLTAAVFDKKGNPVTGAAVNFKVSAGTGKLSSKIVYTGKYGKAVLTLRTGAKAGVNSVRASCEKLPAQAVSVNTESQIVLARKNAGTPSKLNVYLSQKSGKPAVCALITDSNYLPVKGVQMFFNIIKGKGSLAALSTKSDANGLASVILKPEGYGTLDIRVSVNSGIVPKDISYKNISPVHFSFTPLSGIFTVLLMILVLLLNKRVKLRHIDTFTGLRNELSAKYQIKKAIKYKKKFTAILLDLNNFKYFNIVNGYEKGNELIRAIADILKINTGHLGTVYHLGSDDFMVLIKKNKAEGVPEELAKKIAEKIKSFYPEEEQRTGLVHIEEKSRKELPLTSVSLAVMDSRFFPVSNFNEFIDKAEKVMKAAKIKDGNGVAHNIDSNPDIGRQYKIGWFTVLSLLFVLLLPYSSQAKEPQMNLGAWSSSQSAGTGKTVKITAHVSDPKEHPVSNAFVVFSVGKGDGYVKDSYSITDDSGNCSVIFFTGKTKGINTINVYSNGLLPVEVKVTGRQMGMEVLNYSLTFLLPFCIFLLLVKIVNMLLLLRGIDKDSGYRTRFFAEKNIRNLSRESGDFVTTFIQFRDFREFCKIYGYHKGDKVIKNFSKCIKNSVLEANGKPEEIFYYWKDRFTIVSGSMDPELFTKYLIKNMEIMVPLLCSNRTENYSTLNLLIARIESSQLKVKYLEEIMNAGETLMNKAKGNTGNFDLSYSKYLSDEKAKISAEAATAGAVKKALPEKIDVEAVQPEIHMEPSMEEINTEEENKYALDEKKAAEELKEKETQIRMQTENARKLDMELRLQKEIKEYNEKEAEKHMKLEAEKKAIREAEISLRRENEKRVMRELENRAKLEAKEEMAKRETEKKALKLAKKMAKREAKEKARLLAEQTAMREAEVKARLLAEQTAMREAEVKARILAEQTAKFKAEELARLLEETEKTNHFEGENVLEEDTKYYNNKEISCLEQKVAQDPENIELHVKLSDLYYANNMHQKAVEKLLFLADNFFESKLYKYALKFYLRIVEIDQNYLPAKIKIARIYIQSDMDRGAKFELLSISELYLVQDNMEKAEEFANQAIEFKSLEAHYILGAVYYKRGLLKEAAEEMITLLKIKPKHLKALQCLFYSRMASKDFIQALTAYEKISAVEANPGENSKDCIKSLDAIRE